MYGSTPLLSQKESLPNFIDHGKDRIKYYEKRASPHGEQESSEEEEEEKGTPSEEQESRGEEVNKEPQESMADLQDEQYIYVESRRPEPGPAVEEHVPPPPLIAPAPRQPPQPPAEPELPQPGEQLRRSTRNRHPPDWFIIVEIGDAGRQSDAGVLSNSEFGQALENDTLTIPNPTPLAGVPESDYPFVIVEHEAVFNYRLSRARRIIENAFGILAARWRIFRRPIIAEPERVEVFAKAAIALHNYLRTTESSQYIPPGFVDGEDGAGNIVEGSWREEEEPTGLIPLSHVGSNRYSRSAADVRDSFKTYFRSCRWIQQYQNLQQWSVAHCELQNSSVMLSLYFGASVVQSPPVTYVMARAPDGFDAVLVQNVGSTYIIVSWDLPTDSNGILINFSLYCIGALAGVLPLTVISYNTTGLLPFTLYMYMSSKSSPQALHSSWNVVLGVISAAASLPSHVHVHQQGHLWQNYTYHLSSLY
ncbi:hypothetical protein EMCRGX_G002335 [Ephydatia muelleri]